MLTKKNAALDIHLSFLCRTTRTYENGENPIVLRVIYRGQRRDTFTGLTCPSQFWLRGEKMVSHKFKPGVEINRQLQSIILTATQAFQKLNFTGDEFSMDELIDTIKGKTAPPQSIAEYIAIKEAEIGNRVGADLAESTWYKYKRTIRYFNEFLALKKGVKNLPVSKIDLEFLSTFFQFLRIDKKNGHNSCSALMGCLNCILQPAIKNKVIKLNPFDEFMLKRKPVDRDFLELEEIKRLQDLEALTYEQKMKRDIFLFACFTGLAYSDLEKFSKMHILDDNDGTKYIKHPRKKTGVLSIIPLLPIAQSILESYSKTGNCKDFVWRIGSNQKFNKALKLLAQKAEISKNLFCHLGRHTFATTVTLSNGVSLESVGNMLGHTSIKHTMIYAKVVAAKVKNEMKAVRELF